MKIIHIMIACFYIEGMEYQENVLPRKHKELGFDVEIITTEYNFDKDYKKQTLKKSGNYLNVDGIKVSVLKYLKPKSIYKLLNISRVEGLYDLISKANPDIIFVHGCQFYDIKEIIKYKLEKPNIKLYVDNHADYINQKIDTWKRKLYHYFITGHYARSVSKYTNKFWGVTPLRVKFLHDFYRVNSKYTDLLVMGGDENKININNRDVIRYKFRKANDIKDSDFLVVTGGKIDKEKKINLLIEVFKDLDINIKMVIFGEPDLEMKHLFSKNVIPQNVIMLGWIPSEAVYDVFLSSDLGVFPGTHSVLWEQAIATGLPCIFKHWHGMEHVDLGGNAILVDENINQTDYICTLKEYIQKLSKRDSMYNTMRAISINEGINCFSYNEIAKRSIEYID